MNRTTLLRLTLGVAALAMLAAGGCHGSDSAGSGEKNVDTNGAPGTNSGGSSGSSDGQQPGAG